MIGWYKNWDLEWKEESVSSCQSTTLLQLGFSCLLKFNERWTIPLDLSTSSVVVAGLERARKADVNSLRVVAEVRTEFSPISVFVPSMRTVVLVLVTDLLLFCQQGHCR